jgi:hypothetical protein
LISPPEVTDKVVFNVDRRLHTIGFDREEDLRWHLVADWGNRLAASETRHPG